MTLASGSRLGPYEILAPLGAGGMGEVYKARDTRLGRDVAVKVLPDNLSSSAEGRQRFEREARTISQLTHPHICALYDVGREGETEYLVMEYLEGETLSDRLGKGALSIDHTLRYGQEIADALDRAHRAGIVHRDLKPGNVMLTKSGVKLLDFGLAKAMTPPTAQSSLTALPTQQAVTHEGTILGTFQYMAPEQLEGQEADARSDVFALGAVLYEMATGRKAFAGSSRASLISAILRDAPRPLSQDQPMAPAALDRLVRKCLEKNPENRWQSARDVATELDWIREGGPGPESAVAKRRTKGELTAWLIATALAAAFVALLSFGPRVSRPELVGAIRFELLPPESASLSGHGAVSSTFSLSPDGRTLAFVASLSSTGPQVFVRALDSPAPRGIAGSEGASSPFWSPDGSSLAFFANGKLKRVSLSGGPAVTICAVARGSTGTWGSEGTIVYAEWGSDPGVLRRVSASGGEPVAATRMDASRREQWHNWPIFLPDGRRFLYLSTFGDAWPRSHRGIYLGTLGSLEARLVATADSQFAYSSPGFLLFAREGALFAQRFDPESAMTRSEPRMIVPEIETYRPTGVASLSAAQHAPIIAFRTEAAKSRLVWVDRSGKYVGVVRGPDRYTVLPTLRLSPDGKRLAFAVFDPHLGTTDLWVQDLERSTTTRVTFEPSSETSPVWSSDGRRLFFSSDHGGQTPVLFQVNLTNTTVEPTPLDTSPPRTTETLLRTPGAKFPSDVSPDGRFLLYEELKGDQRDVWILPLTGEKKPFAFLATPFDESEPRFSPDGRFVAYVSSESGKPEIYVRRFPADGERWQISRSGGTAPRWSRNGKEIYFTVEGKLMAASVRLDRAFESGPPAALFAVDFVGDPDFEVAADGRLLVRAGVAGARQTGIQIIANWSSELKP